MEFEINHMPFKMEEISEKLFNLQFLSDVTFIVDGRPIYAHSLELMKRSNVFQMQMETTFGEKKIIPITDYRYDTFYQFIRFIYTDKYHISDNQYFDLLKLAKAYNVIRLLNDLVNSRNVRFLNLFNNLITTFNFCVMENYGIALNSVKLEVASVLKGILDSNKFVTIHTAAVEEILKLDQICKNTTEVHILDAFMRWINYYCTKNNIQFLECRQELYHLIRLIRFPTMSNEEVCNIKTRYPDLLTKSDFLNIGGQKIFGIEYEDGLWNCMPRTEIVWPYVWKEYSDYNFETQFTVSTEMILTGFVFGSSFFTDNLTDIKISCQQQELDITEININQAGVYLGIAAISLGTSLRLQPNFDYTIGYKIIHKTECLNRTTQCRKPHVDLFIKAPPNTVNILKAHETMIEVHFLIPDDKID